MDPVALRLALDDAIHRLARAAAAENRARRKMLLDGDPAQIEAVLEALAEEILEASGMVYLVAEAARELGEEVATASPSASSRRSATSAPMTTSPTRSGSGYR